MKLMKAIIGDICGSLYEFQRIKLNEKPSNIMLDGCHFTDDTVCTVAIAEAILDNPSNPDFNRYLRRYVCMYPHAGYGQRFIDWAFDDGLGDSYGNGCCMRQYPISLYYRDYYTRKAILAKSCSDSHNNPESYKYVNILDDAIQTGKLEYYPKSKELLVCNFEEYKKDYKFDCTCEGSVIEAIVIGANSVSYEDCIKTSIYLGGDVDTIACMAGMVCDCDPSEELERWAWNKLPERMQNVIEKFENEIKSH